MRWCNYFLYWNKGLPSRTKMESKETRWNHKKPVDWVETKKCFFLLLLLFKPGSYYMLIFNTIDIIQSCHKWRPCCWPPPLCPHVSWFHQWQRSKFRCQCCALYLWVGMETCLFEIGTKATERSLETHRIFSASE